MRFQKTKYTCGPASIVNALLAIGVKITEAQAEELSCTDPKHGVNELGIIKALKKLGYEFHILHDVTDIDEAWMWLTHQIRAGHPAVLSVENFTHWSSVIGMLGDSRVIYADPQYGLESNRRENGVRSFTRRGLMRIWGSRGRGYRRKYYGIAIVAPK